MRFVRFYLRLQKFVKKKIRDRESLNENFTCNFYALEGKDEVENNKGCKGFLYRKV